MTADAGRGATTSRARRPGGTVVAAVAALLLLGGGTAVAVGVAGQDADPPQPSAEPATGTPDRPEASRAPADTSGLPAGGDTSAPPPVTSPSAALPPVALPSSVSIPAIGVQSELITLGLNPDGTLAVPQPGPDYDKAAWFDGSPRPGDIGPAVIEGHVDSAENGPSVFYSLGSLAVGDRIVVARADGSTVAFQVDDVRVVPKDDFPTLEVYGNTDGPELRLITCGGSFDRDEGHHRDNIVVYARAVSVTPA